MRRAALMMSAAALLCATRLWAGTGATEMWVANYVSNYVAVAAECRIETVHTNGATVYASGPRRFVFEDATEEAVAIVRQTGLSASYGYTNGTVLARVPERDLFRAGSREIGFDADAYFCEAGGLEYRSRAVSNYVWLARETVAAGATNLSLFCAIAGARIQPRVAARILSEGGRQ